MTAKQAPWWRGATIYQIYPRSFFDSNNDGVGDLPGITEKLNYVASLGVDGIWLSPFFTSPMDDFGYDISDYQNVDPIFGSLEDFKQLTARAHKLGLKVIIDQVYSHTSDQHAWFTESRQDKQNAKADWYVWADAKPDGMPPTNWQSCFGGASWNWDNRRKQYYLHNFLASQPDLNLHHEEVQQALLDVAKFWMALGVDGFRLDAINYGMHDRQLRDNPPAQDVDQRDCRPYTMQQHRFNVSQPGMSAFLEKIRALLNHYGVTFSVAEVGGADPVPVMKSYTQGESRLNAAYSFEFLAAPAIAHQQLRQALSNWPNTLDEGWPAWAFSNHDAPRVVSRWQDDMDESQRARFYQTLLLSLRGNVFVYQGEELGLQQADVPYACLQDPEAIANWPDSMGRDGARTPMPWDSAKSYAGFSAAKPWLPIDKRHLPLAVEHQQQDKGSNLNYFRRLMAVRQHSKALRHGQLTFIDLPGEVIAFKRTQQQENLLCLFNLSNQAQSCELPDLSRAELLISNVLGLEKVGKSNSLPALTAAIFKCQE